MIGSIRVNILRRFMLYADRNGNTARNSVDNICEVCWEYGFNRVKVSTVVFFLSFSRHEEDLFYFFNEVGFDRSREYEIEVKSERTL